MEGAAPASAKGNIGFTLIEMLATIAVMAVLAMLLVPVVSSGLESSRESRCVNNLRQMGAAIFSFAADNGGSLPSISSPIWTTQIWPYAYPGQEPPATMPSTKFPPEFIGTIFSCPAAVNEDPRVRDYAFNYRIGDGDVDTRDKFVTLSRASEHALVADATGTSSLNVSNIKARHGDKCNVLFADGHVGAVKLTEEITRNYNGVFWGRQSQAFRW